MNTFSLYFNCRITSQSRPAPDSGALSTWFYPVMYPGRDLPTLSYQYDVMLITLKSYASLNFNVAYFNIEIDDAEPSDLSALKSWAVSRFKCNSG